jgi:hypothetical protein
MLPLIAKRTIVSVRNIRARVLTSLDYPYLDMSNNLAERAVKPHVIYHAIGLNVFIGITLPGSKVDHIRGSDCQSGQDKHEHIESFVPSEDLSTIERIKGGERYGLIHQHKNQKPMQALCEKVIEKDRASDKHRIQSHPGRQPLFSDCRFEIGIPPQLFFRNEKPECRPPG